MPSYSGHDKDNADAEKAYKEGMPGVTAVPVNSDESITAGGSIHCVTQTIPAYQGGKADEKSEETMDMRWKVTLTGTTSA